jgi:BASS family bile acid:Na+ symporter
MMALVVKYTITASVILLMVGVGLGTTLAQIVDVLKQIGLVARGLLANFLVVPLLIYVALVWLPISPDVKIGIMLMAAAPIAPMAPSPFVQMAKGDLAYATGLMVLAALLSVVLTPLILHLSLPKSTAGLGIDPIQIIELLATVQLIPICVGMGVRHVSAAWAERLLQFVPKIGQLGLLVGVCLLLAVQAQQILSIGLLAHLIILLLVIASLCIGDWALIGETAARRRALAIVTTVRNIPLAFLVANASFPGTAVAPVTLVFSVYSMIIAVVYARLMTSKGAGN